jgi:hypothetical protein
VGYTRGCEIEAGADEDRPAAMPGGYPRPTHPAYALPAHAGRRHRGRPVGLALFAAQLGVLPEPAIPLTAILIAIPGALALANLIAAAPARAAARTRPATVLRSE